MLQRIFLILIFAATLPAAAFAQADLPPIAPVIARADLLMAKIGTSDAPTTLTTAAEQTVEGHQMCVIPGMYHCGDGDGMTSIDVMTPLMDWVETAAAPDSLVASKDDSAAAPGQGRTVFAFPATAAQTPGSDADTPANWTAGPALNVSDRLYKDWAGTDFFSPGFQRFCAFEGLSFICTP